MRPANGAEAPREYPTPALVLAGNAKRLKQERGLSLSRIAERAEIHRTHVSLILRGKRTAQIDTVVKLAGALGVEPGELLRGIAWVPGERPRRRGEPFAPGHFKAADDPKSPDPTPTIDP